MLRGTDQYGRLGRLGRLPVWQAKQPARELRPWTPEMGHSPLEPLTGRCPSAREEAMPPSIHRLPAAAVLKGRRYHIGNRTRNECISFRLTAEERTQFEAKRKLAGLKIHEFILECMRRKKLVIQPGADLLVIQLKRIGNNLNQIAHRVNAGQIVDCRAELRAIWDELAKLRSEWQS